MIWEISQKIGATKFAPMIKVVDFLPLYQPSPILVHPQLPVPQDFTSSRQSKPPVPLRVPVPDQRHHLFPHLLPRPPIHLRPLLQGGDQFWNIESLTSKVFKTLSPFLSTSFVVSRFWNSVSFFPVDARTETFTCGRLAIIDMEIQEMREKRWLGWTITLKAHPWSSIYIYIRFINN